MVWQCCVMKSKYTEKSFFPPPAPPPPSSLSSVVHSPSPKNLHSPALPLRVYIHPPSPSGSTSWMDRRLRLSPASSGTRSSCHTRPLDADAAPSSAPKTPASYSAGLSAAATTGRTPYASCIGCSHGSSGHRSGRVLTSRDKTDAMGGTASDSCGTPPGPKGLSRVPDKVPSALATLVKQHRRPRWAAEGGADGGRVRGAGKRRASVV